MSAAGAPPKPLATTPENRPPMGVEPAKTVV